MKETREKEKEITKKAKNEEQIKKIKLKKENSNERGKKNWKKQRGLEKKFKESKAHVVQRCTDLKGNSSKGLNRNCTEFD